MDRKTQVMLGAIKSVAEVGPSFRVRDVTGSMARKSMVHYYFKSKEDLLVQSARHYYANRESLFSPAFEKVLWAMAGDGGDLEAVVREARDADLAKYGSRGTVVLYGCIALGYDKGVTDTMIATGLA